MSGPFVPPPAQRWCLPCHARLAPRDHSAPRDAPATPRFHCD